MSEYETVSHHFLRRTARKRAQRLNEQATAARKPYRYGVEKTARGPYRYRVFRQFKPTSVQAA
jgi:hypothetical protein